MMGLGTFIHTYSKNIKSRIRKRLLAMHFAKKSVLRCHPNEIGQIYIQPSNLKYEKNTWKRRGGKVFF